MYFYYSGLIISYQVFISTKCFNIVLDPLHCSLLIFQTSISRVIAILIFYRQKSEHSCGTKSEVSSWQCFLDITKLYKLELHVTVESGIYDSGVYDISPYMIQNLRSLQFSYLTMHFTPAYTIPVYTIVRDIRYFF